MPEPAVNSSGLFQTPPIPEDLPKIELTENSRQVLAKRYLRRGNDGNPIESIDDMFWRVAWHVADVPEREHNQEALAEAFYRMMASKLLFSQLTDLHRCGHTPWATGSVFRAADFR